MKRIVGVLGACATLLLAGLVFSSPASADAPDLVCDTSGACSLSETVQMVSDACVQMQQYHVTPPDGMCDGGMENMVMEVYTSAPFSVPAASVAAPGQLVAAASSVTCKTWWEKQYSIGDVAWSEKHKGEYCYNGSDVWAPPASKYSAYTYHVCNINTGIGFSVSNKSCRGNKQQASVPAGYVYQQWDDYQVNFLFKGFPIHAAHEMHVNVFASGLARYHWDN